MDAATRSERAPAGADVPAAGPVALIARYPGIALAVIAALAAVLACALYRRGPGLPSAGPERGREDSDPEIERLISAINAAPRPPSD